MPSRWMTPRGIRLVVVVGVSLLFLAALMNLMLVAEKAPAVDPSSRPRRSWSTGTGSSTFEGRETWAFHLAPDGRRIVEVAIDFPYAVRTAHVAGTATLENRFTYWVDGDEVRDEADDVVEQPRGNETQPVRRTQFIRGDWSTDGDPVRVEVPKGADRVVLLLTWDWRYVAEPGADVTFQVEAGEVKVGALDTGGVPGCGSGCGRTLVLLAFTAQVVAFVWWARAPQDKAPTNQEPEFDLETEPPTPPRVPRFRT